MMIKRIHHKQLQLFKHSSIITTKTCTHNNLPHPSIRCMAMMPPPKTTVFDKKIHAMHKNRSAVLTGNSTEFDYIRDEMCENILERIPLISRQFAKVAELGSGKGYFLPKILNNSDAVMSHNSDNTNGDDNNDSFFRSMMMQSSSKHSLDARYPILDNLGIEYYGMCDDSDALLDQCDFGLEWTSAVVDENEGGKMSSPSSARDVRHRTVLTLHHDDAQQQQQKRSVTIEKLKLQALAMNDVNAREFGDFGKLPFEEKSMDLVLGGVYMHWVNNLQGFLSSARSILKPDGVFMGAMLGGDTLHELRTSFVLAEQEREGGVSPHVSPLISIRDAGNLLAGAGFAIPTIDSDFLTVYYPDAFTLMNHLQAMGENNCLLARRPNVSRETLYSAAAIYDSLFRTERGVPATFEIIYMIGWAPDPSQRKAARRGSAQIQLTDLARDIGTTVQSIPSED